jgi:hypothetical protein
VSAPDLTERAGPGIGEAAFARLRAARHGRPGAIADALAARARRPLVRGDGRLFIVAADHPARGALGAGAAPMAMGSRYDLLRRVVLALSRPGVDGVLGTADLIEDLALLGVLEDKIAVGSMNRGGLRGAVFELDDRYTGYDVAALAAARLDAGKLLLRVSLEDPATARTLEESARAVTASARAGLPVMIEPFMTRRDGGHAVNDLSADAVITAVAIAAGLGASSAYTWLKLPVVADMARVMEATTLPALLLGGDSAAEPGQTYDRWAAALALPGVHGLVAGRALLFPRDDDVTRAVDTAASLVHG